MQRKISLLHTLLFLSYYTLAQDIPYNKNSQVACHNCYEYQYATNIEEVFSFTTSIEIDIWDNEIASGIIGNWLKSNKMNRDWYVKHEPQQRGNFNCYGGNFSNCLKRIKNWSDNNPNHNVGTIFIDKKENWSDSNEMRKPNDLDILLISIFGKDKLYTPSILLKQNENLKVASINHSWKTLDSLKGKFIFIITNGTLITSRNPLDEYLNHLGQNAVCFVAPEIENEDEIQRPKNFSMCNFKDIVFYNLQYNFRDLAPKISALNCLSRVYGSPKPETTSSVNELINDRVNFIALFNYRITK